MAEFTSVILGDALCLALQSAEEGLFPACPILHARPRCGRGGERPTFLRHSPTWC